MDFDHWRAELRRHLDLRRCRTNEQRHADACMLELVHHRSKLGPLADGVEPAFRRSLSALFGYKADCVRPSLECDTDHFLGRRHLEIERLVDFRFQASNIFIPNVAAILSQVRGYSIAA